MTSPNYNTLNSELATQGVGMTAAEMHGLLSGILCGGTKDHSWKALVHDLTNEGIAFSVQLNQSLQAVYDNTLHSLEEDGFNFQLYLPDDQGENVFERADALAGWVNHFLLGLGVTQPKLDKVKGEAGEAIDDLRTIAQLGYDEDEDPEELAQSLEEVIEYVRVAALLCHETFNTPQSDTSAVTQGPTLH
ncbi:hypothetical protein WB67_06210 [bacteria symbiont BFo2 of Frankliniella occidentalis]|nr:hypothetical protein WB67_06210 [bacteria symbiont BFo2 of Frankliniella occidentalis]